MHDPYKKVVLLFSGFFLFFLPSVVIATGDAKALYTEGIKHYTSFTDASIGESVKLFKKAIKTNPDFSRAYSALAESYIQQYNRSDKKNKELLKFAFDAAEKALFADARSPEAHKALGSVNFAKGKVEEAIEELERAVDMRPDYAMAWANLGTCWLELGNRAKAYSFFEEAIALKNDPFAEGIANFNLAFMKSEKKAYRQALSHYEKAAEFLPEYYNIYYGIGVALMGLEDDEKAVSLFEKGISLKDDDAATWLGLASAHHRLKNKEEARKSYEKALDIDPDLETAAKGLAALDARKVGCLSFY